MKPGCIDSPTSGEYLLNGKNIQSCSSAVLAQIRNKQFGFVMQDFALVDDYTVMQNIEIPLVYAKVKRRDRQAVIEEKLKKLNISEKKNTLVSKLSGGQRQRVAIARAMVNNPDIILADEPTGALDSQNGQLVIDVLKRINKEGKTVIVITHDLNIAGQFDRIIEISDGKIGCETP